MSWIQDTKCHYFKPLFFGGQIEFKVDFIFYKIKKKNLVFWCQDIEMF